MSHHPRGPPPRKDIANLVLHRSNADGLCKVVGQAGCTVALLESCPCYHSATGTTCNDVLIETLHPQPETFMLTDEDQIRALVETWHAATKSGDVTRF